MESVNLQKRLHRAMQHQYDDRCKLLAATARALEAVSPLATLGRGYAIVKKLPEQSIVRQTGDVQIGMHIETQLSQGRIISTVEELQPEYNLSTQNSSTPNLSKTTISKPKR
jgi:exodeoxyribonuclease VII large subunit